MSILNSHYEISVWKDVPTNTGFEEQKICVIGSDEMTTQSRVIEPNFVRNVNGQKKLSFKMYKQYIDNITGLKVNNPFSDFLKNEVRVKLYYENKWYDFFVKNIVENSSTYLYTYQLEDALVQELSKNGYGVTFNAELMNNIGTAKQLAEAALEDTDWDVDSEVLVEKVEELLIYAKVNYNADQSPYIPVRIYDQQDNALNQGVTTESVDSGLPNGAEILVFYSSSKNKPHRFQFIYLDNYEQDNVKVDENRIITEANCQYYIDINPSLYQSSGEFYLPPGIQVINKSGISEDEDATISTWFKGERYGYAINTAYVPLLNTYCGRYGLYSQTGPEYYGYLNSEYTSPTFVQNVITNSEFKGSTGWVGTYCGKTTAGATPNNRSKIGAKIDCLYGRFNANNIFTSAQDDLKNKTYNDDTEYQAYLKVVFQPETNTDRGILINSGFYDNRTLIGTVEQNENWILEASILSDKGSFVSLSNFTIKLFEVSYNPTTGAYDISKSWSTTQVDEAQDRVVLKIQYPSGIEKLSKEAFAKKNIRLVIYPNNSEQEQTYYISKMQMYKEVFNDNNELITPEDLSICGKVIDNYSFVSKNELENTTSIDELNIYTLEASQVDYTKYIPIYNEGAEKVRTITAAESNYFNILQSIAETFECWLDLEIERNDPNAPGKITKKTVKFKNYAGDTNYASFRYGVNLKDIQRTFESKQLVTKLIVKQNNNELGKNGFCTIARAGSNPTGENYIYDFQYFHNTEQLDLNRFLADMYYSTNPITNTTESGENIQNYFNRIKTLNNEIQSVNTDIINTTNDLTKLQADKTLQESLKEAAISGIDESREKFYSLTGVYPDQIDTETIVAVQCDDGYIEEDPEQSLFNSPYNYDELNSTWDFSKFQPSISGVNTESKPLEWKFLISCDQGKTTVPHSLESYESNYDSGQGLLTCKGAWSGLRVLPPKKENASASADKKQVYPLEKNTRYRLSYKLQRTGGVLKNIGSHNQSFTNMRIVIKNSSGAVLYNDTNVDKVAVNDSNEQYSVEIEGTYIQNTNDGEPWMFIQPNRGDGEDVTCQITDVVFEKYNFVTLTKDKTFYFQPVFTLQPETGASFTRKVKLSCKIKAYDISGELDYVLPIFQSSTTTENTLTEYVAYKVALTEANKKLQGWIKVPEIKDEQGNVVQEEEKIIGLNDAVEDKEDLLQQLETNLDNKLEQKTALNQQFYSIYSRFIQEGTWMSEDYADDDKYYNDAKAVMYNSCYPQVQYTINTIALNRLPGYENFAFGLGDTTYAEDPDFFGDDMRVEIVVTEIAENLDDPSKNTIKVQNFKNQFQDLFQKITATVQQTQYNTGAYKKAVQLAEANIQQKGKFVTEGLQSMGEALSVAGQTTVLQDASGITLTDSNTRNQMRLIGGAILMSTENEETGERQWKTGLTPNGISASLITAGNINAGEISIMNANEPTFKWNSFGISAFDTDWTNDMPNGKVNPYKFVRFDKHGIYGINSSENASNSAINGEDWRPDSIDVIDENSTFALTWEGLKVVGNEGVEARIGKNDGNILTVTKNAQTLLGITNDGVLEVAGTIKANNGYLGSEEKGWIINEASLTYGEIADNNSFILSPYGYTIPETELKIGNSDSSTVWVMTIDKNFGVSNNGTVYAKSADIEGTITANFGNIGGWLVDWLHQDSTKFGKGLYKRSTEDEWGEYYTTGMAALGTGSSVAFWAGCPNGTPWEVKDSGEIGFYVTEDGILHAKNAVIEGRITADYGMIGGWRVTPQTITKGTLTLHADEILKDSLIPNAEQSAVRISCGTQEETTYERWFKYSECKREEWPDGSNLALEITLPNLKNVENITVTDENDSTGWIEYYSVYHQEGDKLILELYCQDLMVWESNSDWKFYVTIKCKYDGYSFQLLNDGSLYASAANIRGAITATSGEFQDGCTFLEGCKFGENLLIYNDPEEYYTVISSSNLRGKDQQGLLGLPSQATTGIAFSAMSEGGFIVLRGFWSRCQVGSAGLHFLDDDNQEIELTAHSYADAIGLQCGQAGFFKTDSERAFGCMTTFTTRGGWGFDTSVPTQNELNNRAFALGGGMSPKASSWEQSKFYVTWNGACYAANGFSDGSDARLKNSITNFSNQYSIFFDNLHPTIFKYNDGTSNRKHSGFIAQEIVSALENSGLSTQDFAAPVYSQSDDLWLVRYNEFIALNTWQIQLLKPRMTAAEQEISQLKEKISILEAELENLKNL